MRRLALVFLLLLAPIASAEGPHSSSVLSVERTPDGTVPRGTDVRVNLTLRPDVDLDGIRLVYCRAEGYLCAAPLAMQRSSETPEGEKWTTTIPWERTQESRLARFWAGVTHVGVNFMILHANGTNESSPVENHPATPTGFESEGYYYFYELSPEPKRPLPGPGILAFLVVGAAALALIKRAASP